MLALVVTVVTVGKTAIAATTFGSNDVQHWAEFAAGVRAAGPTGVYGLSFPLPYNHPPLIGYLLELVNAVTGTSAAGTGSAFPLAIRLPAIAADVVTPFLVLALLARRRPQREALAAAVLVALSPVLLVVSAYHGNTDPVFVMLLLASLYLLVDRALPASAGVVLALALSVKIVPVVVVPVLLVLAVRAGRGPALRFCAGLGLTLAAVWAPALLTHWHAVTHDVLGYAGIGARQWGLVQLSKGLGHPGWGDWLSGPGRFVVLAVAAGVPAWTAWRLPARGAECTALAVALFWFLSPAFATQYLVWLVAPAYLLTFWGATAYNLVAGSLLLVVYTRWSGGLPWDHANSSPLTRSEVVWAFAAWLVAGWVVVAGLRRVRTVASPP